MSVLAFCNPLIDATVEVNSDYLKKWNLRNDDAILADEKYQPLVDEVVNNPNVYMTGGGSCQNSLVMAQWMMQDQGTTAIVGAVGPDANTDVLKGIMNKAGVKTIYQTIPDQFTGCGVILVCDNNRSIVASVAASGHFNFEKWDTPEVVDAVRNAKVILVSTYFLRSSDKTGLAIAAECAYRNIPLAITLSSPSAIESEAWPALKQLYRVASIIFGNTTEMVCMGKQLNILGADATEENTDIKELTKKLANWDNPAHKRVVVTTMGAEPTIACESGSEVVVREIIQIEASKIVDTNGAGDSFAGGFLAYYIRGAPLAKCIDAGNYSSYFNLQQRGCAVPPTKPSFE
ncbi:Adenosine kinase [Tritrichomonas foetus]|uniref:Adenosine kinase n=1 Tax=Tritrichomonas foetus TaxID=1144522 RepID=A0A1J4J0P9_9EUKA|nr:Adenosine kinase [Tritrichomonas foetus]|eukprot:OHS93206.1 Adenosine kinase [Tritrichomonas foetus]